jgi:hypothetical protein
VVSSFKWWGAAEIKRDSFLFLFPTLWIEMLSI